MDGRDGDERGGAVTPFHKLEVDDMGLQLVYSALEGANDLSVCARFLAV